MKHARVAFAVALLGLQMACSQAGDTGRKPQVWGGAAEPVCDATRDANCAAASKGSAGPIPKPATPAVPESPMKTDCSRLPTQVEKDTCANRKDSTG